MITESKKDSKNKKAKKKKSSLTLCDKCCHKCSKKNISSVLFNGEKVRLLQTRPVGECTDQKVTDSIHAYRTDM